MKKVLLTNIEIVQFSGSEINCMTIAKRFKQLGYEVYVGALKFDEPLYSQTKEDCDYCINLLEDEFDFSNIEFDIIWAQHSFLLDWLIFEKNVKAKRIINSCLSPKEAFECPALYANNLNMIIANSMETKEKLEQEGVNNIELFENYSFEDYFKKNIEIDKLKNIAIVSNHIPEEEKKAAEMLKEKGYNVDIYGLEGKKVYITDDVLKNYDLIISIGKTVQYAMSLAIPVYIYDIHGGPGYLLMENMEKNRQKNFSGRGYSKKSEIEICDEIESGFNQALEDRLKIKEYALENFCFETIFDNILNKINQTDPIDLEKIKQEYSKYERNILVTKKMTNYIIGRYNAIIDYKENNIKELKEENKRLYNEIAKIDKMTLYEFIKRKIKG